MLRPLTALRFVFALMVFTAHCVFFIPGGKGAQPELYSLLYEGFIGVNFFFILSGFILAYRYAAGLQAAEIPLKTFWLRRLTRIYPTYLLCLLLAAGLHFQILQQDPRGYFRDLALHLSMTQTLVSGGKHAFALNGPAWSVADEMIFYLLFPLVIRLAARPRIWKPLLTLAIASVVTGMICTTAPDGAGPFYINPFVRLVDFMLGIALFGIFRDHRDRAWSRTRGNWMEGVSLALLLVFVLFRQLVPLLWRYSVYYWVPMLLLIYTFAMGKGRISALLSRKLPVLFGEASYAFYLFHTPAAIILSIALRRLGLAPGAVLLVVTYFACTLAGSLLIFRYLERPAIKFLRRRFIGGKASGTSA